MTKEKTENMEKPSNRPGNRQFAASCTAMSVIISIVNVMISFMAAKYICAYTGSTLIPYPVLLICMFTGLETMLYFFTMPLSSLVESMDRKKRALLPKGTETNEENAETMPDADAEGTASQTESKDAESVRPADYSEQYARRSEAARRETEAERKARKEAMMEYIRYVMPSILEESDMQVFCIEYQGWLDDPFYKPIGRSWKWKTDTRFPVKHLDMRHLTWNIAKRMGMDRGYSSQVCGCFIKQMFPDLCCNVQVETLVRSLSAEPRKGNVMIDEVENEFDYSFHYKE